jgi:hypothetical protein
VPQAVLQFQTILARDPGRDEALIAAVALKATRALPLKHDLPYAPGSSGPGRSSTPTPARTRSHERPMVWEGAVSIPITGPARVVRGDGLLDVPAGVTLPADERER